MEKTFQVNQSILVKQLLIEEVFHLFILTLATTLLIGAFSWYGLVTNFFEVFNFVYLFCLGILFLVFLMRYIHFCNHTITVADDRIIIQSKILFFDRRVIEYRDLFVIRQGRVLFGPKIGASIIILSNYRNIFGASLVTYLSEYPGFSASDVKELVDLVNEKAKKNKSTD